MTSERFMHTRSLTAVLIVAWLLAGCGPTLVQPAQLTAPSPALWGIAPFANESGVSRLDTLDIADAFTDEAQDVRGLAVVPVNRVIAAMDQLELDDVTTEAEAAALCRLLGLDGLVVGTITAYDPYRPPKLGLAVQLYAPESGAPSAPDSRALTAATSGPDAQPQLAAAPTTQAYGLFDGRNHATLLALSEYAAGRTSPDAAYGDEIYLVRMDLFARFACHHLLRDLMGPETVATARPD